MAARTVRAVKEVVMKEVGIGFWGLGMIGKTHLESLRLMQVMFSDLPDVTAQVLCTRTVEHYKDMLFCEVTSDSEKMLNNERVTLVDIPSPNYAHFEQTKAAIEHNKHVYLEKPIAVDLESAAKLVTLAENAGIVNRVALIYRFVPAVAAMCELVKKGYIGDVIHFNMKFYHYSYLDPERPTSWRQQAALSGGGSMMDLGIHFTDIINWMFGEVDQVSAAQRTIINERYKDSSKSMKIVNDTEEWCTSIIRMKNGVIGTLESSRVSTHIDSGTIIEVFGTKGSLKFDVGHPEVLQRFNFSNKKIEIISDFQNVGKYSTFLSRMVPPPRNDSGFFLNAHIASLKSVIEATAGNDSNPESVTFREAYEAQRLVAMIMQSAAENRNVHNSEFPSLSKKEGK